jgi:hypothetical protein
MRSVHPYSDFDPSHRQRVAQPTCQGCGTTKSAAAACSWCGELNDLINSAFVKGELPAALRSNVEAASAARKGQCLKREAEEEAENEQDDVPPPVDEFEDDVEQTDTAASTTTPRAKPPASKKRPAQPKEKPQPSKKQKRGSGRMRKLEVGRKKKENKKQPGNMSD